VWAESEEAGTITSAAASRRLGSSIGLALIKRRFWDAGRLRIDAAPGSITAEALELPFVRAPSRQ
jgi:glycine cleavage system aminomethyltransferase T